MIGKKLLHYEVTDKLGQGGMGEVYRARDTRLGRDVALKVLPEVFADDAERLARFRREAQLLASLNHPNIAAIYGLEEVDGMRFLAMELVEGETLADRMEQGTVPLEEAVSIARQIAEALEDAHEKGIVHRDLKPGNVQLAPDGRVKVLDFGLGKLVDPGSDESDTDLTRSPTVTGMTAPHVILGTAAYMSPEQAKGKAVSWRADIWSYGVILFEMIAGRRLFDGETVSETLASVMKDSVPWSDLPSATPALIHDLLRRCLERNPRQRLQSIGDARIALEEYESGATSGSVIGVGAATGGDASAAHGAGSRPSGMVRLLPWLIIGAALVVSAIVWTSQSPQPSTSAGLPLSKFTLEAGAFSSGRRAAVISPDGRSIAYTSQEALWVRSLDKLEPRRIVSDVVTDEQLDNLPIWSPDGTAIAYASGSRLYKVSPDGGSSTVICGVTGGFMGGAWLEDGSIVYASPRGPMYTVPATGGDPQVLIPLNPEEDVDFHEPCALPGGGIIYSVHRSRAVDTVEMFRAGERHVLFRIAPQHARDPQVVNYPTYSPSGHIVYRREQGTEGLWAVPFDVATGTTAGDPILVADDGNMPSFAHNGTMVYMRGDETALDQLEWVDFNGNTLEVIGEPARGMNAPVISPDGSRIAFAADNSGAGDLWVHDLRNGTRTRLTFTTEDESQPRWVPGEDRLLYTRWSPEGPNLWSISASGAGQAEQIATDVIDFDVSPDGQTLVLLQERERTATFTLRPRSGGEEEVIQQSANVILRYPRFSPDGKYLAYLSWENRAPSTYIREIRGDGRWLVPGSYESRALWSPTGDAMIYNTYEGGAMFSRVSVETTPVFRLGAPENLFPLGRFAWFDVARDGSRLLIARPTETQESGRAIAVVQNWWSEFAE